MADHPQQQQQQQQQGEKKCKPLMMALPASSPPSRKRPPHSTLPLPARRIHKAVAVLRASSSSGSNPAANPNPAASNPSPASSSSGLCNNSACRAAMVEQFDFCRRCSCCLCKRHDENKDPSFWLVCGGDDDDSSSSGACGLSCHLHCLVADKEGLSDSSYRCGYCGTTTNFLGCIKKQLVQAQGARRVDSLYQRLDLATKLITGSERHHQLAERLQTALDTLLADIGPQTSSSSARTLVTRTSSGSQVLDLIAKALELILQAEMRPEYKLSVKQATWNAVLVSASEIKPGINPVLGYKIWHKKLRSSYSQAPSMSVDASGDALVIGLHPSTGYMFRAVAFSAKGDEGSCECRCSTSIHQDEDEEEEAELEAEAAPPEAPVELPDPKPGAKASPKPGSKLARARGEPAAEPGKTPSRNLSEESGSSFSLEERAKTKTRDLKTVMNDSQVNVNLSEESRTDVSQSGEAQPEAAPAKSPAPAPAKESLQTSPDITSGKKSGTQSSSPQEPAPKPAPNKEKSKMKSPVKRVAKGKAPKGTKEVKNELEEMNSNLNLILSGPRAAFLDARSTASAPSSAPAGPPGSLASINAQAAVAAAEIIKKMELKQPGVKKKYGGDDQVFDSKMFEQCAKMVRWLERQGHLESEFRMRFFTWLGVKANEEQKRVVNIFIQSMMGDPPSLASQLVDVFDEVIQASRHNLEFDWV